MIIQEIVTACPAVDIILREAAGYRSQRKRQEGYSRLKQQLEDYVGVHAIYGKDQCLRSTQAYNVTIAALYERLRV